MKKIFVSIILGGILSVLCGQSPPPFWRLATGADTIQTTDCGHGVALPGGSGGTQYSETLPPASSFPSYCHIVVSNIDMLRGKQLVGFPARSTGPSNILWMGQTAAIDNINNQWVTTQLPGPLYLAGTSIVFHVAHVAGSSDTNNDCLGTGTGSCYSITGAVALLREMFCGGGQPIIQDDDTSPFTEAVSINGPQCPGTNNLQILGNPNYTVTWNCPTAFAGCLFSRDHATVVVGRFTIQGIVTQAYGLGCQQGGLLSYYDITWGMMGGGSHLYADSACQLVFENMPGAYDYIQAGATFGSHVTMKGTSSYIPMPSGTGAPATYLLGSVNYSTFYNLDGSGAYLNTSLPVIGNGSPAYGSPYSVTNGASLELNGTMPPNNTGNVGNSSPSGIVRP